MRPTRQELLSLRLRANHAPAAGAAVEAPPLDLEPPTDAGVAEDQAACRAAVRDAVHRTIKPRRLSICTGVDISPFPLRWFRLLIRGKKELVVVTPTTAELRVRAGVESRRARAFLLACPSLPVSAAP